MLNDALQQMKAAISHHEFTTQLEPDLRLDLGRDYALVSTLKSRGVLGSMGRRPQRGGASLSRPSGSHGCSQ
jgi:hypothetical protein